MDTQAGAQSATNSQTTIDLQAGIIASQQREIDRLNILAVENAAEIARLKKIIEWYQGEAWKRMGAVARAEIAADGDDEIALLKRQIDNLKRHIEEYCPAAPLPAQPDAEWLKTFNDLLEDYVGACAETAVFNATQRSMTVRMEKPRYKKLVEHVSAAPQLPVPAQSTGNLAPDAMRDAVAKGLKGLYYCGRVWSAWGVGTMSEDDFTPAEESDECIDNVIDHINDAIQAAPLPELTGPSIRDHADFVEDVLRLSQSGVDRKTLKAIRKDIYDTIDARVANFVARALAASPSPAPAPTEPSDLTTMDCPDCGGSGTSKTGFFVCEECHGQGKIIVGGSDVITSPASRMGGITSKESAETAAPGASTEGKQ